MGFQGPVGQTGPPATFLGNWNSTASYLIGAAVFYNNSSYVSLVAANSGNEPDTSPNDWSLLARQGAAGLTFRPLGYAAGTIYGLDDVVYYAGSSYISLAANNINHLPTGGLPWSLLAQQGAVGPAGAASSVPGPQGPAGAPGASTGLTILGQVFYAPPLSNGFYFPVNSAGDSTAGGQRVNLVQNQIVIPVSCTIDAFYVYSATSSGTVLLLRSTDDFRSYNGQVSLTFVAGTQASSTLTTNPPIAPLVISAGDAVVFYMDGGSSVTTDNFVTTGLHCGP
jgi:hypothetical protein